MSIIQREHTYSSAKWEATAGYSRAVKMGPFIYVAGTTATDPVTGKIVGPNDVYAQSVQIWENISAALGRLGASLKNVVRTRMFVVDIHTNGPKVAEAHAKYFMDVRPASTMLGIPALYTPDMLVEFDVEVLVCDSLNQLFSSSPKRLQPISCNAALVAQARQAYLSHSNESSVVSSAIAEALSAKAKALGGARGLKVLSLDCGDASVESSIISMLATVDSHAKVQLVCSNSDQQLVDSAAKNLAEATRALGDSSHITASSVLSGTKSDSWDIVLVLGGIKSSDSGKVADYLNDLLKHTNGSGSQVMIAQHGAESLRNRCSEKFSSDFFHTSACSRATAESVVFELSSVVDDSFFVKSKRLHVNVDVSEALLNHAPCGSSADLLGWFLGARPAEIDAHRLAVALHFIRESSTYSNNQASVTDPIHLITATRL